MIVTCERCTTQFQLDDSRVPEAGVRVRCSRCKHAFLVEPPAKNELEKVQRVARRALQESEEGPEITQDLPASSVVEGASGAERDLLDDDESDWEFNDGSPGGEERSRPESVRAAQSAVDALLAGSPGSDGAASDGDFGDALDESDALDLELGARQGPEAGAGERLDFDTVDFGEAGDLGELGELGGAEAADREESPPGPELETALSSAPAAAEPPAQQGDEELGSPAEWDIFDEPAPPRAEAPPETLSAPAALPAAAEQAEVPAPDVFDDEPAGESVWLQRVAAGIGWAVTAALCAAALSLGLVPRSPVSAGAAPAKLEGLQLEDVSGRWLDNARHGFLYVVSGSLRNPGDVTVAGARVALVLRDAAGRRLGDPVPLGPPVDTRLLREARLDAIRKAQESTPNGLPSVIAPRRSYPFQAVVGPVPADARRFGFELPGVRGSGVPEPGTAVRGAPTS